MTATSLVTRFEYTRDAVGNPLAVREYNGETRNFEYDTAYRLTREVRKDAGGGTIYDERFVYDPAGNRTRRIKDGVETRYFHNANNQVVEEVTADTTTRYFYDRNGNQIRKVSPGVAEHYDFDELNRMTAYRKVGGGPPETTTYTHRGGGHIRASKTTGGITTRYLLDGYREIAEYENGTQTRYFTHGTYIDEVLGMYRPGESPLYYSSDALYSVAALTDPNGNVVERMKYDAYGTATVLAPDGVTVRGQSLYGNPWTFTGRRLDNETGLNYYRARMYSAGLGRFTSRDPIGYTGSKWNVYQYVDGQPSGKLDPHGLESFDQCVACCMKNLGGSSVDGTLEYCQKQCGSKKNEPWAPADEWCCKYDSSIDSCKPLRITITPAKRRTHVTSNVGGGKTLLNPFFVNGSFEDLGNLTGPVTDSARNEYYNIEIKIFFAGDPSKCTWGRDRHVYPDDWVDDTSKDNDYYFGSLVLMYDAPGVNFQQTKMFSVWATSSDGSITITKEYSVSWGAVSASLTEKF